MSDKTTTSVAPKKAAKPKPSPEPEPKKESFKQRKVERPVISIKALTQEDGTLTIEYNNAPTESFPLETCGPSLVAALRLRNVTLRA